MSIRLRRALYALFVVAMALITIGLFVAIFAARGPWYAWFTLYSVVCVRTWHLANAHPKLKVLAHTQAQHTHALA